MSQTFNWSLLLLVLSAVVGISGVLFGGSWKAKTRKTLGWIGGIFFVVFVLLFVFGGTSAGIPFLDQPVFGGNVNLPSGNTLAIGGGVVPSTSNANVPPVVSTYQPTATYTTTDKFAQTTSVTGTGYWIKNGQRAVTSSISNIQLGDNIQYWVDNGSATSPATDTYFTTPQQINPITQTVSTFNALAYANGSVTLVLYDPVNHQTSTNGNYNTSLGANKIATEQLTFQGTAKKSSMPFGGDMVIEYNNTISSVTCTGDGIISASNPITVVNQSYTSGNPFHLTYSPTYTSSTYQTWAVANLDDGSASLKTITCQYQNGGTAVGTGSTGSKYIYSFFPANYYISQTGVLLLDVEKNADQSTTRTASNMNAPTVTGIWGA